MINRKISSSDRRILRAFIDSIAYDADADTKANLYKTLVRKISIARQDSEVESICMKFAEEVRAQRGKTELDYFMEDQDRAFIWLEKIECAKRAAEKHGEIMMLVLNNALELIETLSREIHSTKKTQRERAAQWMINNNATASEASVQFHADIEREKNDGGYKNDDSLCRALNTFQNELGIAHLISQGRRGRRKTR